MSIADTHNPEIFCILSAGNFTQEVRFSAGATDQVVSVEIPIANNEIALEQNLQRRFGLRGLSSRFVTIGQPSVTTAIIVDDDG